MMPINEKIGQLPAPKIPPALQREDTITNACQILNMQIGGATSKMTKSSPRDFRRALRVEDQNQFMSRFTWYNLPMGITGNDIERMLYYRYQIMMWYDVTLKKFKVNPFALRSKDDNNIDDQGRYMRIRPLPFNGKSQEKDDQTGKWGKYYGLIDRKVYYDIPEFESKDKAVEALRDACVIIRDYSPQVSQENAPRVELSESFIEEVILTHVKRRLCELNSSGFSWIRLQDKAGVENIMATLMSASQLVEAGIPYAPIGSTLEIQQGATISSTSIADFWASAQGSDNMRLRTMGIQSDGMLQKQAQQNIAELSLDSISAMGPLGNAWAERLQSCLVWNSMFGTGTYCEPSMLAGGQGGEQETSDVDNGRDMGNE